MQAGAWVMRPFHFQGLGLGLRSMATILGDGICPKRGCVR